MKKRNSVKCEACNGFGWTVAGAPAADWGTVCDVCRGRGSLSEYRIAQLCARVWLGPLGTAQLRMVPPSSSRRS
jgi:hypothetical protein